MNRGRCEAELLHQRQLLGALPQRFLPVASLAGVLVGERGRVIGQARGLGVGFFGGIHMLVTVPEPLVRVVGVESAEPVG